MSAQGSAESFHQALEHKQELLDSRCFSKLLGHVCHFPCGNLGVSKDQVLYESKVSQSHDHAKCDIP